MQDSELVSCVARRGRSRTTCAVNPTPSSGPACGPIAQGSRSQLSSPSEISTTRRGPVGIGQRPWPRARPASVRGVLPVGVMPPIRSRISARVPAPRRAPASRCRCSRPGGGGRRPSARPGRVSVQSPSRSPSRPGQSRSWPALDLAPHRVGAVEDDHHVGSSAAALPRRGPRCAEAGRCPGVRLQSVSVRNREFACRSTVVTSGAGIVICREP